VGPATGNKLKEISLFPVERAASARSGPAQLLGCSPDGRLLALKISSQVRFVQLENGHVESDLHRASHAAEIDDLALSPDGELLATCSADITVGFWRSGNGRYAGLIDGLGGKISQIDFAGRNNRLLTLDATGMVTMWRLTFEEYNGAAVVNHAMPAWSWSRELPLAEGSSGRQIMALSEELLAVAGGDRVTLLRAETGDMVGLIEMGSADENVSVIDLACRRDSKRLAALRSDGLVVEWNVEAKTEISRIETRRPDIRRIAYCKDVPFFVAVGQTVSLWRIAHGDLFCEIAEAFSPASLATGSNGILAIESYGKGLKRVPLGALLQQLQAIGLADEL
jgi:WD40 repeat protein